MAAAILSLRGNGIGFVAQFTSLRGGQRGYRNSPAG